MKFLEDEILVLFRSVANIILTPHYGRVHRSEIKIKADGSLVTRFDVDAAHAIADGLKCLTPGFNVVDEESIDVNPQLFRHIGSKEWCWIVDPLDGTADFKRGLNSFGIMAALAHRGVVERGYIYVPSGTRPEAGHPAILEETFVAATLGGGCRLNGVPVTFAGRPKALRDARVSFACRNEDAGWEPILADGAPGYLPRRNCASDYVSLMRGDRDAVFYSEGRGRCAAWDHAAGVLAVREAGGFAGAAYWDRPGEYLAEIRYDRLLTATSETLWRAILADVMDQAPDLCEPSRVGA